MNVGSKIPVFFQSGPPLAALGYRAAVVGELGVELTMPPVRRAFENRNIPPQDAGQTLFLKNAGPRGEDAWVFPSGRIVTATSRSVADTRIFGQLLQTWNDVARTIVGVTAQIEASHVSSLLQQSSEIYTQEANQLQSLFFQNQSSTTGWRLSWPDAKPSWATLMATGSENSAWPSRIAIGEKIRISNGTRSVQEAPIHDLQFGEHSVSYDQGPLKNRAIDIQIVAYFQDPRGRIAMFDSQNAPAATREVLSKPLDSLYLPLPPEPQRQTRSRHGAGPALWAAHRCADGGPGHDGGTSPPGEAATPTSSVSLMEARSSSQTTRRPPPTAPAPVTPTCS